MYLSVLFIYLCQIRIEKGQWHIYKLPCVRGVILNTLRSDANREIHSSIEYRNSFSEVGWIMSL